MNQPQVERVFRDAVAAGDAAAWRAWYEVEAPRLEAFVLWRCSQARDLAEDVLQETWMTAVRRMRDFRPESGDFHRWLCGIAANVVRNQLRSRRRRPTTAMNEAHPGPTRDRSAALHVAEALASLPEHYELVLREKYVDRCSVAEMAARRGESEKAVESLLSRARAAFREAYDHDG